MVEWTFDSLRNIKWEYASVQKGRIYYKECQNIITFDIESSNGFLTKDNKVIGFDHDLYRQDPDLYDKSEPQAIMYVWQCSVEDMYDGSIHTYMGRTWERFLEFMDELSDCIRLGKFAAIQEPMRSDMLDGKYNKNTYYHIYIQNLGFEFQFMLNIFEDLFSKGKKNVFARNMRKPMKVNFAYRKTHIILNDTLVLVQKSLERWGEDADLEVKKLKEPKSYYLPIRSPETPLTQEEINYSENDVVTMVYGVRKYRDKYGKLGDIPMTQTGEVRRTCIRKIANANEEWEKKCKAITLAYNFELFEDLVKCFVGGWTHANSLYTNMLLKDVRCFDFASSYPAVMCTRKYPVGPFTECTMEELDWLDSMDVNDRPYRYFIKVRMKNIRSKTSNTFWSSSKADEIEYPDHGLDNGKIYKADLLTTTMTDLDWEVFRNVYDFEDLEILKCMKSEADYLPKEMIQVILEYYMNKTSLKGVGRESEYNEAKQFINSIYGVAVTRLITDAVNFIQGGWKKFPLHQDEFGNDLSKEDLEKKFKNELQDTTKQPQFTTYQIGVWVTAWARHNLWDAIRQFDEKIVYCDTDSVKGLLNDQDLKWFNEYNDNIMRLAAKVCIHYNLDIELFQPETKDGEKKPLGFFAREDDAVEFKTLGAKRYCVKHWNKKKQMFEIETTIAGLPKDSGIKKISKVNDFIPSLVWDTEESEKLISYYIKDQKPQIWIDRDGNEYVSSDRDRYGICLMPTTFDLSVTPDYEQFFNMMQGYENDPYFELTEIFRDL